jgi:hypothetical protein
MTVYKRSEGCCEDNIIKVEKNPEMIKKKKKKVKTKKCGSEITLLPI